MIENFKKNTDPFVHYISIGSSVPDDTAEDLLKMAQPSELINSSGSRADYKQRTFLNNANYETFSSPVKCFIDRISSEDFYKEIHQSIGVDLRGADIRAEVACDIDGFFQIPHLDTDDKRITWLTYLGTVEENGDVGTDLFNSDKEYIKSAPWGFNNGLIFLPGNDTWHGFRKEKAISGYRKVLIINYVDGWNDEYELYKYKY